METINLTFIKRTWVRLLSTCIQCAPCPLCSEYLFRLAVGWSNSLDQDPSYVAVGSLQKSAVSFCMPCLSKSMGHLGCRESLGYMLLSIKYHSNAGTAVLLQCSSTVLCNPGALTFWRAQEIEEDFKLLEFLAKIIIVLMALIKAVNPFLKVDITTQLGFKRNRYLV